MIVEIPDRFMEHLKMMPVQKVDESKRTMKNINPLRWIEKNQYSSVAMVIFLRAVMKRGIELGWIEFDASTQTWKGIDCDGR